MKMIDPSLRYSIINIDKSYLISFQEFVLKVSEWFGWFLAVSLFPDPELVENTERKRRNIPKL